MAYQTYTTKEAGSAVWPHLHAADTKFNEGGVFHTKVEFPLNDASRALMEQIDTAIAEAVNASQEEKNAEAAKKKPGSKAPKIKQATAPYTVDEDAGTVTVNFKRNATKKDGTAIKPPRVFDAKGKPLVGVQIGGGSRIKVAYSILPFPNYTPTIGMGVKLGLDAVQVLELKQFGGPSASNFGFGEEEGFSGEGFEATTDAPVATLTESVDGSDF